MSTVIKARTVGHPDADWTVVTPDRLAAYCLHQCGGGFNEKQVEAAMLMQRDIMEGKPYKHGNIEIMVEADSTV